MQEEPTAQRVVPQLAILLVAVVIAAAAGATTFAVLAAAYAIAWLIVNVAMARRITLPRAPWRWVVTITILVAAVPVSTIARHARSIADRELLVGLDVHTADRLRLEAAPQIHPALVLADRPQLFFVHAPGARAARIGLGPASIDGEPLGHGLFRVDYDPRRDGAVDAEAHEIDVRLEVDGTLVTRRARFVAPAPHPRWLRPSPDRARACTTSEETDELLIVGARGEVTRVPVLDGPTDCAWVGEAIAVSHRYAPDLAIVRDGEIADRIEVGAGQEHLAASTDRIAITRERGEVVVVGVGPGPAIGRAALARHALPSPDWIAIHEDAVIVAQRAPAALTWIRGAARISISLRAPAVTMALAPRGGSLVIAATDHAADDRDARAHLGNHFVQDQLIARDLATRTITRHVLTAGRTPRQDAPGGLDRGTSPLGIDEGPDGAWCVAFAGSDEVAIVAPVGEARFLDVAAAGVSAPHSCVVLAGGAIVVTSPSNGAIAFLRPDGRLRALERVAPADDLLLARDPEALQVRFGERAFYETTRSGIACQSCHLHGGSDGLGHNIGSLVLAPTLDTRGVVGTSPYLRDGSYPRLYDLHEVADDVLRGYREPAGDRGATIEAWISTLPPPLPIAPRDAERERRGLDAFVRAGCATCHAMPAFTNLGRHPTASVFPDAERAEPGASLDTPSLRAVSRRSRWLFDGRARRLEDVLTEHSRAGRHGAVADLDDAEIADLVIFLRSL